MVNREYIKAKIDALPDEDISRIDDFLSYKISAYNKKTQKAIRDSYKKPNKSEKFKNAEELYKDLGI